MEVLLDHGVDTVFGYPGGAALNIYDELYKLYCELHDSFGVAGTSFDHASLMKRLLDLRSN